MFLFVRVGQLNTIGFVKCCGSAVASMRIRILFFYILMWIRIQGANLKQMHPDPDPGQTLPSVKVEFLHENVLDFSNRSENIPKYLHKLFLWAENQVYFHFCLFPCSWFRIRITDPEPNPAPCSSYSAEFC
jgi:hypothetical protein